MDVDEPSIGTHVDSGGTVEPVNASDALLVHLDEVDLAARLRRVDEQRSGADRRDVEVAPVGADGQSPVSAPYERGIAQLRVRLALHEFEERCRTGGGGRAQHPGEQRDSEAPSRLITPEQLPSWCRCQ